MAGGATFGKQFWRRFALIEILRNGHRSNERGHDRNNKQTVARFHWRHQFSRVHGADEPPWEERRKMAGEAQSAVQAWQKVGVLPPLLRSNPGVEQLGWVKPSGARSPVGSHLPQYGGFFFSRCARAASIHHSRSSAKRGNACDNALPPSPLGLPSSVSVCAIGPTAIELEITTMPISESVPCHASAARAPEKRPAE